MPADHEALADLIRNARTARGLPTHAAAHRAGISGGYWSDLERLTIDDKAPSVPYLRSVADVVGLDRAEVLSLAGYDDHAVMERGGLANGGNAVSDELTDAVRELTEELRGLRATLAEPPLTVLEARRRGLGR